MKKFRLFLTVTCASLTLAGFLAFASTPPVNAQIDVFKQCTGEAANTAICKGGDKLFGAGSIWNRILNTLTFVIGGVSVLMIIIGGLRYTLSSGDEKAVTAAKNTILYSIVGLVLALMANAIVNFVLVNI